MAIRSVTVGKRLCLLALLLGGSALHLTPQPPSEVPREYRIKAAYLLNFTKFVEWPSSAFPDPASPFSICLFGRDPFGRALDDVAGGETVDGHNLVVRRVRELPDSQPCHMVFIASPEPETGNPVADLQPILERLGPGVLTVGEGDEFLTGGGMVAFVLDDGRVRFDIDQNASAKAGLQVSSKLLRVARTVQNGPVQK
jgi:hypothetical protein